jgi:ATP-dependent helicase/nuclease subunit B
MLGTVNPGETKATFRAHNILGTEDLLEEFASRIGNYFRYPVRDEEVAYLRALYGVLAAQEDTKALAEAVIVSAYYTYVPKAIEKSLASRLYGEVMECSVSSLEKFAGCAYAHFLRYGLNLREREIHSIESNDIGNITHAVLEEFGKYLKKNGEEFAEVSREKSLQIIEDISEDICNGYGNGLLGDLDENDYLRKQLKRILRRCIDRLKDQLRSGDYKPAYYEQEFKRLCNEGRTMLKGKIDRIDSCETDDAVFVKIVDYKSGSKDWESVLFDCGVQLQTAVYLSEAIKKYRHDFPDKAVLPGAMFYYRMQDPLLDASKLAGKDLEHERNVMLRPTGLVVEESEIITHLEREPKAGNSEVIPVSWAEDGTLPKGSKSGNGAVRTKDEMEAILQSADEKVSALSEAISSGVIDVSPLVFDKYNACEYCAYKSSCGFDERLGGYRHRVPRGGKEAEEE